MKAHRHTRATLPAGGSSVANTMKLVSTHIVSCLAEDDHTDTIGTTKTSED